MTDTAEATGLVMPRSHAQAQISMSAEKHRYPLFPVLTEGCPRSRTPQMQWPVEVEYDMSRIEAATFESSARSVETYSALLPPVVWETSLGEGDTPLLVMDRLKGFARTDAQILIKDESQNPTWSHKDRLNRITVSAALLSKAPGIVVSSSGNHGISAAAYAARAGLPCILLTNAGVNPTYQVAMRAYGAAAVAVPAESRWGLMRRVVDEWGYHPVSNLTNWHTGHAFGPEGYKPIAYELYCELRRAPAAVFVPTGYGELLFGIYKGFLELKGLGIIAALPRLFSVEPEARGPLARAMKMNQPTAEVPPGPTRASAIACTVSGYRGAVALNGSHGRALVISDETLIAAQAALAHSGIFAELSGAAGLGGLQQVAQNESFDGAVVLVQTSSGLKDPLPADDVVPTIEPDWEILRNTLRAEYGLKPGS